MLVGIRSLLGVGISEEFGAVLFLIEWAMGDILSTRWSVRCTVSGGGSGLDRTHARCFCACSAYARAREAKPRGCVGCKGRGAPAWLSAGLRPASASDLG